MPSSFIKTDSFPHFFCKSFFLSFCGWSLAQNDEINIYNWQFATIHILLVLIPVVFLGEGPDYIINNCQLSTIPLHFYPLSWGLNSDQLSIIPILYYLLSYVGKSLNCNITNGRLSTIHLSTFISVVLCRALTVTSTRRLSKIRMFTH